jgi:hypothetical protein
MPSRWVSDIQNFGCWKKFIFGLGPVRHSAARLFSVLGQFDFRSSWLSVVLFFQIYCFPFMFDLKAIVSSVFFSVDWWRTYTFFQYNWLNFYAVCMIFEVFCMLIFSRLDFTYMTRKWGDLRVDKLKLLAFRVEARVSGVLALGILNSNLYLDI